MLDLFREKLTENIYLTPGSRIILTVSGGIDSTVMAYLFHLLQYELIVTHCNFGLRGSESDGDEEFVRNFCQEKQLKFISEKFQTRRYASENGLSIQMAARELRYSWFEKIRLRYGFDFIATAHNLDDQVETFFINLSRGTGIRGLSGISFRNGNIIRPLIFFTRKEIREFANQHQIRWREDSSNSSLKYSRNKIRHSIIPLFKETNPSFERTMVENMRKICMAQDVYLQFIMSRKEMIIRGSDKFQIIGILDLLKEEFGEAILYEILTGFNFSSHVIADIWNSLEAAPGKKFFSDTHRLIKDRNELIIEPHVEEEERKFYIEENQANVTEPIEMKLEKILFRNYTIPSYPDIASLDMDKLDFPLILRKWHTGDYFYPLGMENPKKLSDFFIDNKFSIPQKEQTWLLCSGQDIVWVIGHRIDDRFKLTPRTQHVLKVSVK